MFFLIPEIVIGDSVWSESLYVVPPSIEYKYANEASAEPTTC